LLALSLVVTIVRLPVMQWHNQSRRSLGYLVEETR
jgi:hypothetical protein